ncbi:MAG: CapA family protein, partial [Anaerolineaceae bacterium]|nr:CapA family protein [Anaerolineaceae bacterium]
GSSAVLPTPTPPRSLMSAADFTTLWIDPAIPPGLRSSLVIPVDVYPAESKEGATLRFEPGEGMGEVNWVFALTVPFPTIIDQVSLEDVQNAWRGKDGGAFGKIPLLVSPATLLAFSSLWGAPAPEGVRILDDTELLDAAWGEMPSWAIVPFENLSPRWKVLRVNGLTPLDNNFHLEYYPLTVKFTLTGELALQKEITYLNTNRDPEKLTTLVMTGVTALVRSTAAKMEKLGMGYPARDIGTWLEAADLTHVSNEVSFVAECPPANPYQKTLMFCSRPEYIDLLKQSGVDIVELTGNHLVDWRRSALVESLALYQEYEMHTYGSGKNLEEARQPLLVEHNGNRLAFLGCNPAGPEAVWATEDLAGAAPCDYEWMKGEIGRLRAEGYLPIVTLQYFESYSFTPTPGEQRDFPPLAEAGAVIVSGSQAHYPQGMAFIGDGFVHYGLGNLFFDQMYMPVEGTEADKTLPGTRKEFIDRHVFYDGRYIGVELLTALLEDFAKPRPMTMEERVEMLTSAFENSSW